MRVYETKKVMKEVEVTVKDINLCDKCNKDIDDGIDQFEDFEFDLVYKHGEIFPGDCYGEKKSMELCKDCADDCIKLLEDNGYRITKADYGY